MTGYRYLVLALVAVILVSPVAAIGDWDYTTTGSFSWTCPANVTMVWVTLVGGGASGHGGWTAAGTEAAGHAGNPGSLTNVSGVVVVPGTSYTIVVPAGGAQDAGGGGNVPAQAGSTASAFGSSAAGGAAVYGLSSTGNGENAANGYFSAVVGGDDGESVGGYTGGTGGTGYGAPGGGGSANDTSGLMGYGGKGWSGAVLIWEQQNSIGNFPDFTASATTGGAGTSITFTDNSVINDNLNLTYEWDFGDGTTSSTAGSVTHIYAYYGTYTVSLTISSDTGDPVATENELVQISPQESSIDLKTEPKPVQFHVQTFWGAPLTNANVSVIGITTSTGNWDWIPLLLGIPLDEVALNGTAMYQTTDSLGNTEFLMIPSAKYNISTTAAGYEFPLLYITPHDERYTVVANINGTGWFPSGNNTLAQVNITVSSAKINDTLGQITVTYDDEGDQTTGGDINLYMRNATRGGADVLVATMPVTGNTFTNTTNVTLTDDVGEDNTITVSVEPDRTSDTVADEPVIRTFTVWFKGKTVEIDGFDSTVLLWLSLFIIIFTAMFAGATHAPQISIMICVEAWVFYAMGWLDPLTESPVIMSDGGLIIVLLMATFIAVLWNFREGKRKEKGT